MKYFVKVLVLVIAFYSCKTQAQTCKVLDTRLNKKYEGNCKKGKAHGEGKAWGDIDTYEGSFKSGKLNGYGVYTWGDGSVYKGNFKKGKMEGEGILVKLAKEGATVTQKGFFRNDLYLGRFKDDYRVLSQQSVRGVLFRKNTGSVNEVHINVYANGKEITKGIVVKDENNSIQENRSGIVLSNVQFPLKRVEVTVTIEAFKHYVMFDIYNQGNWEVNISL